MTSDEGVCPACGERKFIWIIAGVDWRCRACGFEIEATSWRQDGFWYKTPAMANQVRVPDGCLLIMASKEL